MSGIVTLTFNDGTDGYAAWSASAGFLDCDVFSGVSHFIFVLYLVD